MTSFILDGPAPGKPRMTQRDKWKQRPCVVAYRGWCDRLRAAAPPIPVASDVAELIVTAEYAPPASWSRKRRLAAIGQRKRTKPDGDNILKAVADALWRADEALGDMRVMRRWGPIDRVYVQIVSVPAPALVKMTGVLVARTPTGTRGVGAGALFTR